MATMKVIDVSHHQGEINWEKVKADGVQGAIIRTSDSTGTIDRQYDRNIKECTRLGIPFGLYIYSRAKDKTKLQEEINLILERANKCNKSVLLFPLYIDLEQSGCEGYANTAALEFKKQIEAAGYYAGVYANKNWFDNYVGDTGNMTRWAARYSSQLGMTGVDMWQYSSGGSVNGISGSVDMNYCYRDFPTEIRAFYASTGVSSETVQTSQKKALEVDGKWGTDTTLALQTVFDLPIKDGVVSNQKSRFKQPGCYTGWEWESNPKGSSDLIKAIQKLVGATVDGWIGPDTIKKMQAYWGTVQDGKISAVSDLVKAMQKWVNEKVA